MDQLLALVWVGAGAVLLGLAAAVVARARGAGTRVGAVLVSVAAGAFLICAAVLAVAPVHAVSTTIDAAQPGDVTCDSAWTALGESPFVETEAGPEWSPAHGACQAAAWRRAASLGSGELGIALIIGVAAVLLVRRRDSTGDRHATAART